MTPFVTARRRFDRCRVHFLPTASVVMTVEHGAATQLRFLMPHRTVRVLDAVVACARLSPNFIKCSIGEPRHHLGAELLATAHPMLAPFAACDSLEAATELFRDLRRSLVLTADERDFLEMWRAHEATGEPLPTSDRWIQRLCLRFAGQAPKTINTVAQLARTLKEDDTRGLYNSLGAFADASHFARVCRAYTGHTPSQWRHMSQTFY